MDKMRNDIDKTEAIKQWNQNPCGKTNLDEEYTKKYFDNLEKTRYKEYAPWIEKAVGFQNYRYKKILEIGFGQGTDLLSFAKKGAIVTGVDLTPTHFEITKKRFKLYNKKAELKLRDADNLSCFQNNTFDLVYSMGVIHHNKSPEKIINEIHRVLKPGGKITIIVYNKNSVYSYFSVYLNYILRFKFIKHTFNEWKSFIEYRSKKNNARPYVELYTKKRLQLLFNKFKITDISTYHLEKSHFGLFRYFLFFLNKFKNTNKQKFGWYLVLKGNKL